MLGTRALEAARERLSAKARESPEPAFLQPSLHAGSVCGQVGPKLTTSFQGRSAGDHWEALPSMLFVFDFQQGRRSRVRFRRNRNMLCSIEGAAQMFQIRFCTALVLVVNFGLGGSQKQAASRGRDE